MTNKEIELNQLTRTQKAILAVQEAYREGKISQVSHDAILKSLCASYIGHRFTTRFAPRLQRLEKRFMELSV